MMSQDEIRYLDMTEEASILAIEPPNAVDVTEPTTTTQATATIAPTTPLTRSTTPMPTLDITTQFPAITTEMMTTTSWPQSIATTTTTTTTTTTVRTDPFQHHIDFSVHSGDAGSSNITMPNAVIVVVVPKTEGTLVLTTITPKATPPSQKMYSKVIIKFKISNFMHCYFFCPLNNFFCLSAELANQQRPPHFNYFS